MKSLSILFVFIVLCLSCANKQEPGARELVPHPEKYVQDGYAELADSLKPQFIPDVSIGKISLLSSKQVDEFLGADVMERIADNAELNASIISNDSEQRLLFYFHPGSTRKEFSEFEVRFVDQKSRDEFIAEVSVFQTESGIRLGMTMGEFRATKGEPDHISNNETTIFHYKIDDYENSAFLKGYNMPRYSADYEFSNGYLIRFKFGFEYP